MDNIFEKKNCVIFPELNKFRVLFKKNRLPEQGKDYTVYCDASKNGLGCVLMQDQKVIAYGTWNLKIMQLNSLCGGKLLLFLYSLTMRRNYLYSIGIT